MGFPVGYTEVFLPKLFVHMLWFLVSSDFEELVVVGDPPESCAVCLYEFEGGEEIRWLRNCRHVFHRACLDRWMDHDQKTCPLCRTPFVPDELQDEFNQRLWAASGVGGLHSEYVSVPGL
ncbi:hypothetical protein CXB51_030870 [Gossypium anomalum]|uniref:RING-type domain-containing protein n=1 Tax=Gossypium anomalum TaxID=47600 RepID=A0A8J6CRN1_9ROSI|nr:hypothetical protein CXB51_030870 [Gossypium anomalum]